MSPRQRFGVCLLCSQLVLCESMLSWIETSETIIDGDVFGTTVWNMRASSRSFRTRKELLFSRFSSFLTYVATPGTP